MRNKPMPLYTDGVYSIPPSAPQSDETNILLGRWNCLADAREAAMKELEKVNKKLSKVRDDITKHVIENKLYFTSLLAFKGVKIRHIDILTRTEKGVKVIRAPYPSIIMVEYDGTLYCSLPSRKDGYICYSREEEKYHRVTYDKNTDLDVIGFTNIVVGNTYPGEVVDVNENAGQNGLTDGPHHSDRRI